MLDKNLLLSKLSGKKSNQTPVWFMRQAGRYLPEYMEVRNTTSNFLEFCYSPKKASEVTIQPITRFDFDAAIIFSDILVIPDALGMDVSFIKNEGPKIIPLSDIESLNFNQDKLLPVYEAIKLTRSNLAPNKDLIGFAGAPWTLATYMIEGGSSRDFLKVKNLVYSDPKYFAQIIEILVDAVACHLIKQVESGADILQLFDSWAGTLSPSEFFKWSIEPAKKIVSKVKSKYPDVPIIGFPRGAGVLYKDYAENTGVDAISFDQHIPCDWIAKNINIPVQGNLDPVLLFSNKDEALKQTKIILDTFKNKPFIFNLGHGILQHTPIENVAAVVKTVKEYV
jgi:uroporphyrinogen decarboxylase